MSADMVGFACPSCGKSLPEGAYCTDCMLMAQAVRPAVAAPVTEVPTAVRLTPIPAPPPPPPPEAPPLPSSSRVVRPLPASPPAVAAPLPASPEPSPASSPPPAAPLVSSSAGPSASPPPRLPPPPPPLTPAPARSPLQEFLAQGYQVFLLAGLSGSGKTHLMETFRGQDTTSRVVRNSDGLVLSTRPAGFDIHPFPHGQKKAIFVDASGEQYRKLYAVADQPQGKAELELLQQVSGGLGGLILMLNLHDYWQGIGAAPQQPRALINVLRLLRWLRGGGRIEAGETRTLPQKVDAEVERMPRLAVPVLLLFSLADHLVGHELPAPKGGLVAPGRKIFPPGEEPLLILHHYLPELLEALEKHVHCFHVDFSHSVVTDPGSGKVVDEAPCGVALARDWLLAASDRQPYLPSAWWLRLDRLLRARRWQNLPPLRPLGA